MRYSIFAFLLYYALFSCVYAATRYKITQAILHDTTESSVLKIDNKEHIALLLELTIAPQILDSTSFNTSLSIQDSIKQDSIKAQQPNSQYKYIMLKDFIIDKTQHIATPLGSLSIKQDSILKHAYIEFSKDTALQNAMLISHDTKVYLVCFDTTQTDTDKPLAKDSDIKNLLEENSYEISSWRYFLVLGIMIAILILLYVIKLRQNRGIETSSIVLEQAKILDSKNKIALIKYGGKRYLIGINPHGITLLDSIHHDTQADKTNDIESSQTQQSFTQILSEKLLSKQSKRQ